MNNISLSFCIPTYNRSDVVYNNVLNILKCTDRDIEVIVLDNGSTDDTVAILSKITDKRLKIYVNDENLGVLSNILNVLDKGTGTYVVFSTDKDAFDPGGITNFKEFLLNQPGLAAGFCEYNSLSERIYDVFPPGYPAIERIAYQAKHPTGYFFNNKMLKSIGLVDRFSDQNMVDTFPFDFVFGELCLIGSGAIYHPSFITPESGVMAAKIKSFGTNGTRRDAFFSPESKLKLAINFATHINTLKLSEKHKNILMIDVFFRGLNGATFGYRTILNNKNICTHYGMESRPVKSVELIKNALIFCVSFFSTVMNIRKKNFFEKISFCGCFSILVIKKIAQKFRKLH